MLKKLTRLASHLCTAMLLVSCGAAGSGGSRREVGDSAEEISFEPFGDAAFDRARREHKMVLVDVGIEGCTACRWMFEDTYRDADVIARVNQHFVAVAVDANVRPDLGDRYAPWGWPATIVLTPEGEQVLALRGNKRPRNFIPILDELIDRHRRGALASEAGEPIHEPVDRSAFAAVCDDVTGRVAAMSDAVHGGFGSGVKLVELAPVEHAFFRAHLRGDEARRTLALRTVDGWAQLIDPVWGGVFVAARHPDWSGPIPEKRTVHQAAALFAFAEAAMVTSDPAYVAHAERVHHYVSSFLTHEDGTFYATQEDEAPGLPANMSASDYYALSDTERRRHGVPPVDHGIYTDLNGAMIRGYARLYEATLDERFLRAAMRAADALLVERVSDAGWVRQSAHNGALGGDARMRDYREPAASSVFLKAQPHFGLGLLALYRVTGATRYRDAASRIASGMIAALEDPEHGGFFAARVTGDGTSSGPLSPAKPFYDNVAAARFLLALAVDTHDKGLRGAAVRALSAVAVPSAFRRRGPRVADLALAIEALDHGAVEISVVAGDPSAPSAQALFAAGLRIYEPRKALHYEAPGRYPDLGRPGAFVCNADACSSPVFEPEELSAVAARFALAEATSGCAR